MRPPGGGAAGSSEQVKGRIKAARGGTRGAGDCDGSSPATAQTNPNAIYRSKSNGGPSIPALLFRVTSDSSVMYMDDPCKLHQSRLSVNSLFARLITSGKRAGSEWSLDAAINGS